MYRNIVYNKRNRTVSLMTWDENGERITVEASYEPYLYLETKKQTPFESLFDTFLKKRTFNTPSHRYKFLNDLDTKRVFENIRWDQQYLIDTFTHQNDQPEFTQHPIKTWFIDIETYSPGEFPVPDKAADTINVITVYDTITQKFTTWGLGKLDKPIDNCTYIACETESELLEGFLSCMEDDSPDILSGWNSEFFDIPYIVNRVARVFGEDACHRLSPVGTIYPRTIRTQFGREAVRWFIDGVSCIDYLDVYKKFSVGLRESYKLDAIASTELGERKVDYGNINLATLADDDWQTFVEYNVQDVNLLARMEEKLRYLELLRMLAYTGLTPFESAMGTLPVITGAAVLAARKKGKILPTFVKTGHEGQYEGAYVGEPQKGFQESIISFDANSLYPNTMITLNLSPETKVGKIIDQTDTDITIRHESGKIYKLPHQKFYDYIKKEKIAVTRAKVLFSQKHKGIMPEIVDKIYQSRVDIKGKLQDLKIQLSKTSPDSENYSSLKTEVDRLDIKQFTLKILINTVYGYFGNKYAPIGDSDIARSITLTGQAVIKQSNKILRDYIMNNSSEKFQSTDPVIYNDTDSSYISIKSLLESKDIPFHKDGIVTDSAKQEADMIEDYLNVEITKWAKASLNSIDPRFVFKREAMSDSGLFLAKKRYVLRVLDDEGIPCDKFKYTGVEVVRTTMPASIKPEVKSIIETMLMTKNFTETNDRFLEVYDKFKSLPIEDYAFVMGVRDYDKYADKCVSFNTVKHMPIHVKASYIYNTLLKEYGIDKDYESISSGDKVRYFYVKTPNKYGIRSLAYKYYFPEEFTKDFHPDIEMMFDKIIYNVVERFYDSVGWVLKKPGQQVQTDLFDLLCVDD
jgi:DNA polymerase elongation subunit (family B)